MKIINHNKKRKSDYKITKGINVFKTARKEFIIKKDNSILFRSFDKKQIKEYFEEL